MTTRTIATITLGLTISCSSSNPAPLGSGNGQCVQRHGSYLTRYAIRSGTCGPISEVITNIDKQPTSVDPPCKGSISYSADNCEVTYETTCPNADAGDPTGRPGEGVVTGKSKWSTDAASGSAVEQIIIHRPDGTTLCQGTYDVTITRQ